MVFHTLYAITIPGSPTALVFTHFAQCTAAANIFPTPAKRSPSP